MSSQDLRKDARQRFIDAAIYLRGAVNTSEIENVFGIGHTAASKDLKNYRDARPGQLVYQGYSKSWIKTDDWKQTAEFWADCHPIDFLKALRVVQGLKENLF